jgi:hypothetical protein
MNKQTIKTPPLMTPIIISVIIFILLFFSCRLFKSVFTLDRLQAIETYIPRRLGWIAAQNA